MGDVEGASPPSIFGKMDKNEIACPLLLGGWFYRDAGSVRLLSGEESSEDSLIYVVIICRVMSKT